MSQHKSHVILVILQPYHNTVLSSKSPVYFIAILSSSPHVVFLLSCPSHTQTATLFPSSTRHEYITLPILTLSMFPVSRSSYFVVRAFLFHMPFSFFVTLRTHSPASTCPSKLPNLGNLPQSELSFFLPHLPPLPMTAVMDEMKKKNSPIVTAYPPDCESRVRPQRPTE